MATSDVGSPAVPVTTRGPPSSAAISPNISPDPRSAIGVPLRVSRTRPRSTTKTPPVGSPSSKSFCPAPSGTRDPAARQPPHLFGGQSLEHGDFADDLFHHYPPGFLVGLGRGVSGRGSTREAGHLLAPFSSESLEDSAVSPRKSASTTASRRRRLPDDAEDAALRSTRDRLDLT